MPISIRRLDKELYAFEGWQKALIRARLVLYREGLGTARSAKAWSEIAQDITDLPGLNIAMRKEAPGLTGHLKARWEFYSLFRKTRGQHATIHAATPKDFSIGEDALNKWATRGVEPLSPVIAAIRDFLIVKRHLLESDLETEDRALAATLAANHLARWEHGAHLPQCPEFPGVFIGIDRAGTQLVVRQLIFSAVPTAGYLRVSLRLTHMPFDEEPSWKTVAPRLEAGVPLRRHSLTGYIALGLSPHLFFYWNEFNESRTQRWIAPISEITVENGRALILKTPPAPGAAEAISEPEIRYVSLDHEYFVEIINEIIHNIENENHSKFYSDRKHGRFMVVYISDDALYEYVSGLVDEFALGVRLSDQKYDVDEAARMIRAGAEVNYYNEREQSAALLKALRYTMSPVVDALLEREDLNCLIRSRDGRLPSDLAFMNGYMDDIGHELARREAEQARQRGIDLAGFLTGAAPAP